MDGKLGYFKPEKPRFTLINKKKICRTLDCIPWRVSKIGEKSSLKNQKSSKAWVPLFTLKEHLQFSLKIITAWGELREGGTKYPLPLTTAQGSLAESSKTTNAGHLILANKTIEVLIFYHLFLQLFSNSFSYHIQNDFVGGF